MKRDKWIHCYVNSTGGQQMKPKLSILILLASILLSLPFIGCGVISMSKGTYEAPKLSKSELATVIIDTDGGWLQRYKLIAFHIDGKLALRRKIKANEEITIGEILVAPGKRDMSVMTIDSSSFDGDARETVQILSKFTADVKAGGTYLLKDDNKLVDVDTDEVVSQWKLF